MREKSARESRSKLLRKIKAYKKNVPRLEVFLLLLFYPVRKGRACGIILPLISQEEENL